MKAKCIWREMLMYLYNRVEEVPCHPNTCFFLHARLPKTDTNVLKQHHMRWEFTTFTTAFVSTLSPYGGHDRAEIQQAGGLCQEVLCKAHGESLQHQSACTEVVNWLISAHYSDPLGTWVPFRALMAEGVGEVVGWERGKARKNRE